MPRKGPVQGEPVRADGRAAGPQVASGRGVVTMAPRLSFRGSYQRRFTEGRARSAGPRSPVRAAVALFQGWVCLAATPQKGSSGPPAPEPPQLWRF